MTMETRAISRGDGQPVSIACHDGVSIAGHLWGASNEKPSGCVIINPATGVVARYYHRYARFLASHGFDVLTYDYRGIGQSRPASLKGCGYRWRDWGERDFDAAIRFMRSQRQSTPLLVVGHSIGGFLPGLAENGRLIDRMLTVGAQYAWWVDYTPPRRLQLLLKWHIAMPVITALYGYFPGRRLGWLEDLPAHVAYEWSFRGPRFERSHPGGERKTALARMSAVTAPILAVTMADDEFATIPAIRRTLRYYTGRRTLRYYTGAPRSAVQLEPSDYGREAIGHFNLFHDSHAAGFWADTLVWLRDGQNPWPRHVIAL